MKIINIIVIFILSIVILAGCAKNQDVLDKSETDTPKEVTQEAAVTPTVDESKDKEELPVEKTKIKIAALKGPTSMGMVKMMEDAEKNEAVNDYTFTIAGVADEITASLINGDFDVAAVPCNLASVLYNKTKGEIVLAGVNTLGVLYIIETGDSITSIADLKGKTIYSTGLGTTPQYTLNYLLESNGIDVEKDVQVEYKSEATEVAAILSGAENAIAMLPQPFVTTVMMNNDKVRIALEVSREWDEISEDGSSVVTGVVVVRREFLENNKEAFDAFLEEYKKSADYTNNNIAEAAALIEKYDIFKAAVAEKAIPYCNITMITGDEIKEKVGGYLATLYRQNPKSVGGNLPGEDFYYIK